MNIRYPIYEGVYRILTNRMDNARKARSRLVRALGVLGKSVRRERARVRINRDRTPQGVCLQTTR